MLIDVNYQIPSSAVVPVEESQHQSTKLSSRPTNYSTIYNFLQTFEFSIAEARRNKVADTNQG